MLLGDPPSALNAEQKVLLSALDTVRETFNLPIYSFIDLFTIPKSKSVMHYQDMKRHGLEKVYFLLETGSNRVVKAFRNLTNVTDAINIVNNLKTAGLNVGLIVLAGTGGKTLSREHVEATAGIVGQMQLGEGGDSLFICPVREDEDSIYAGEMDKRGPCEDEPGGEVQGGGRAPEEDKGGVREHKRQAALSQGGKVRPAGERILVLTL